MLCVSLLMPGALYAMDAVKSAKWSVWTRFYLERKHDGTLKTSFFAADAHHEIDGQGNVKLYEPAARPGKTECPQYNPASINQEDQSNVRYSADLDVIKVELDDKKDISKLTYQLSISKTCGDKKTYIVVPLSSFDHSCVFSHASDCVVTITTKDIEPFDLYVIPVIKEDKKS